MDFVRATSTLIDGLTLNDLALSMGVSRGLLGQSRLHPTNPQHRKPPEGWQAAVARLAEHRSQELARLADRLGKTGNGNAHKKTTRRTTPRNGSRRTGTRTSRS
jgi:hypothetical protein